MQVKIIAECPAPSGSAHGRCLVNHVGIKELKVILSTLKTYQLLAVSITRTYPKFDKDSMYR